MLPVENLYSQIYMSSLSREEHPSAVNDSTDYSSVLGHMGAKRRLHHHTVHLIERLSKFKAEKRTGGQGQTGRLELI